MSTPNANLITDMNAPLDSTLKRFVLPGSRIDHESGLWRFTNEPVPPGRYTNSQIDDYQGLRRRDFLWRPPLTLTVKARFSHNASELKGTAGFGFWNDPFMMTGARMPSLPRTIWFFFASPPSNMKLDLNTPGSGWKAATLDAIRLPFFLLAPTTPLAVPLMNIPALYRALWPIGQRAIGVSEAALSVPMAEWHTYSIDWGTERAVYKVDDHVVLDCDTSPRGPLGFVMWIDNQSMIATPQGQFGWRALALEHSQSMEIADLRILT